MSNNPYAGADMAHDKDLSNHDAKIDAWEGLWFPLVLELKAAVKRQGFESKEITTIIERAAGDICDTYVNNERSKS